MSRLHINWLSSLFVHSLSFYRQVYGTGIFGTEYKYNDSQKLTVLIPCWGKAKYVKDTVKSVLDNSLLPDKVIILLMDEDSVALKSELEAMSNIIDCREHERLDVARARNYLATLADSEWLMFLDADDQPDPCYFETLLKGDEPNSINAAIRASMARGFDLKKNEECNNKPVTKSFAIYTGCLTFTGCFIVHRDVMEQYQFDPDCNSASEDTAFLIKVYSDKKFVSYCYPERIFKYLKGTDNALTSVPPEEAHFDVTLLKHILPHVYDNLSRQKYLPLNGKQLLYAIKAAFSGDFGPAEFFYDYENRYRDKLQEKSSEIHKLIQESAARECFRYYKKEDYLPMGYFPESIELDGAFDACIVLPENASEASIFSSSYCCLIHRDIIPEISGLPTWRQRLELLLAKYTVKFIGTFSSESSYKELSFLYKKPELKYEDTPFHSITFSLNRTCSENCAYCNQLKVDNIDEDKLYENFDRYLTKAEEAYGVKVFPQLLGGEPTLLSYGTQIKILGRLKEYPMIMLFTNGYDKSAPLYVHPNVIKNVHAMTLTQAAELIKELKKPDLTVYVATKGQLPEIEQWLESSRELVKDSFQLIPCMNTGNAEYDCGEEELVKIAQLTKEYKLNDFASPELTEVILQQRFDIARAQCPKKTSTLQVDCITGKVLPCCNYAANVAVDIDEFDFNDTTKYLNAEACSKCLTLSNYTR